MKNYLMILMALFLVILVSGCSDEAAEKKDVPEKTAAVSHEDDSSDHAEGPHEPGEEDVCAFCNMKVYPEEDPMGVFTAQAKTESGEYVFFDDSGCLLNSPRRNGAEYEEKWVRDYVTSEWIPADDAVPVKADLKTPMKYGYAFFKDKAGADQFISENTDKNPVPATWMQIDELANERYQKKMKMQSESDSNSMEKEEEMDGEDKK